MEFDNSPKPEITGEQYREAFNQAQEGEHINPADVEVTPEEAPQVDTPAPTQEPQAPTQEEPVGDISDYFDVASGKVKDEYWDKANIPEDLRKHVEAGLQAEAAKARQVIVESAGGEETFKQASEWADKNWSPAQKEAFNEALNKGTESAKLVVAGMVAAFNQANGNPRVVEGTSAGPTISDVFEDMSEYLQTINTQQYKSSPAFRQKVTEKLSRSKQAGKL